MLRVTLRGSSVPAVTLGWGGDAVRRRREEFPERLQGLVHAATRRRGRRVARERGGPEPPRRRPGTGQPRCQAVGASVTWLAGGAAIETAPPQAEYRRLNVG